MSSVLDAAYAALIFIFAVGGTLLFALHTGIPARELEKQWRTSPLLLKAAYLIWEIFAIFLFVTWFIWLMNWLFS